MFKSLISNNWLSDLELYLIITYRKTSEFAMNCKIIEKEISVMFLICT